MFASRRFFGGSEMFCSEGVFNVQIVALAHSIRLIRLAFAGANRHDCARHFADC